MLWLVIKNRLGVQDRWIAKGILLQGSRVFCTREVESHSHLFFYCSFTKDLWVQVLNDCCLRPYHFLISCLRPYHGTPDQIIDQLSLNLNEGKIFSKHGSEGSCCHLVYHIQNTLMLIITGDATQTRFSGYGSIQDSGFSISLRCVRIGILEFTGKDLMKNFIQIEEVQQKSCSSVQMFSYCTLSWEFLS